MDIFSFLEFITIFILLLILSLIGYFILIFTVLKKRFNILSKLILLLIIVVSSSIYPFYKAWRVNNPPEERFVYLFENYTNSKLPKDTKVIDKNVVNGFNDGWEAAILEIGSSDEYYKLKKDLRAKKNLKPKKFIKGRNPFGSGITKSNMKIDSVLHNYEERFVFAFLKDKSNRIVFQKMW